MATLISSYLTLIGLLASSPGISAARLGLGPAEDADGSAPEPKGGAWAVLVVGGDPGPMNGGHLGHFLHMCTAYRTLVPRIGDDRIILIGDFDQALKLFQQPNAPGWVASKRREFVKECEPVMRRKPDIYTGDKVNPDTVMRVLSGAPSEGVPRVVQCDGSCTVFLAMDTHGWHTATRNMWYARLPCKAPKKEQRHWYGSDEEASKLGSGTEFEETKTGGLVIANAGANISSPDKVEYDQRGDRYSLVFRSHYIAAFRRLKENGCTGILALNQWCGAGGFTDIFKTDEVLREELPVAMISATSAFIEAGASLPTHFWPLMASAFDTDATESTVSTVNDLMSLAKRQDDDAQTAQMDAEAAMYAQWGMAAPAASVGRSQVACGTPQACAIPVATFFSGSAHETAENTAPGAGQCANLVNAYLEFKAAKHAELQESIQKLVTERADSFWQQAGVPEQRSILEESGCAVPDTADMWTPAVTYTTL